MNDWRSRKRSLVAANRLISMMYVVLEFKERYSVHSSKVWNPKKGLKNRKYEKKRKKKSKTQNKVKRNKVALQSQSIHDSCKNKRSSDIIGATISKLL